MQKRDRREYMREYQRNWVRARRAEFFKDKSCVKCGSKNRLELDHINPKTKIASSIWSWSAERREAEIKKCQILCFSCHKKKSAKEVLRGTDVPVSKINESIVREIRDLYAEGGHTKREIARQFQIDEKNVRLIIARRAWAHVK